MTPPNIPVVQRVGTNIIEDDSEDAVQQLRDKKREKVKRDNRPETQMRKEIKHTTDRWIAQRVDIQHGILSNRYTENL